MSKAEKSFINSSAIIELAKKGIDVSGLVRSITELYAVNEFRIENNLKPLIANVYVDGEPFEYFVGTGLTISSSVGSTAYNLTLGGAAVCCELESLQLTPIQPSTQCKCFKSSLILPVDKTIYLEGLLNNVLLGYDFIVKERLSFKSIAISTCDKEFILLNKEGTNTLSKLKKLYNYERKKTYLS